MDKNNVLTERIYHRLIKSNILNSSCFVFFCGGLLGALFFIYIFGTAILDFTYTDWIMAGYADLASEYTGWNLFRNSTLHFFPFCQADSFIHPFKLGLFYCSNLFAIIFKLLSPVLPENFQYLGLQGILYFTLQGGIGALIVRKIGGNAGQSIIGSLFFTLSTVLMWRIYFHTSLSAHFIILLCILAYLENNNFSLKKQIFIWGGLLVFSVLIMTYFAVMVMVFMFFCLLRECIITKNIKNQCIVFGVPVFVMAGIMLYFGAFNLIGSFGGAELFGEGGANLNAFVNPQGLSYFIKDMPVATYYQYEGFAYLGLGIILFVVVVIFQYLQKDKSDLETINKQTALPIIGIVLSFFIFSMSPTITFNQYKLFTYPVIQPVKYLWSLFRATGRMIWPVVYIIITFCIWRAITQFSVKKSILVLSVFLLIQWADLKPWFAGKGAEYKTKVTWQNKLPSPVWNDLANKYKHIFFMGNLPDYPIQSSFLYLAGNHKMTVNDMYLGRISSKMVWDNKQKESEYLMKYGPKNDMVYVFQDMNQAASYRGTGIYFYNVDNMIIGIDSKINLP